MTLLDLIMESQHDLVEYLTQLMNGVKGLRRRCDRLTDMHALSSHAGEVLFALMQEQEFGGWRSMTLDEAGLVEYTKRRPLMFRCSGDGVNLEGMPEGMLEI